MANAEIHWDELEANLQWALAMASDLGATYLKASQQVRRKMNQAVFEEILIEVDGSVIYARMAQPFSAFHDEEFKAWLATVGSNAPSPNDDGSSNDILVGAGGLEPSASAM